MRKFIFPFIAFVCAWQSLSGATINASSLSQSDVQAAIDASASGDTIVLPAGTATWTTGTYGGGHGIGGLAGRTLLGAGVAETIITEACGLGTNFGVIAIGSGTTLTGFTILQADANYSEVVVLVGNAQDFRIHDLKIDNIIRRGIMAVGGPHARGVVWDCELRAKPYSTPGDGTFQLATVSGPDTPNGSTPPVQSAALGSWKYAPSSGTEQAVFFEDCVFWQNAQGDATIETYYGGQVIVRYSAATNFILGIHGRDSSVRSGHWIEVYRNTILNNIGNFHPGTVISRGGTGVVWENAITQTGAYSSSTSSNKIQLQSFRSAGNLNPTYTLRFPYNGGQLDGHSPYDGNTAAPNGSGTHTGANGAATLVDATKSWTANQLAGTGDYATDNTLKSYFLWNLTTGAGGPVVANGADTATATLAGGTRQTWNTGDNYVLTFGYPGLDQNGYSGPTTFAGVQGSQVLNPWYSWGNTFNGTPNQVPFRLSYVTDPYTTTVQPDSALFIQENREFYNATQKPGYTPYTYPHPLRGGGSIDFPPSITLNPVSQNVIAGATVTFTAEASGNPVPTWQWSRNGAEIGGQTNSTLILSSVSSSNDGSYTATATNSEGSATTSAAVLVVGSAGTNPVITLNPTSRTVAIYGSTTFTASATGNPAPTWQWYFNGTLMPGQTAPSLTLASVLLESAGAYSARASNSLGTANTSSATLSVSVPPDTPTTPLKAPTLISVK